MSFTASSSEDLEAGTTWFSAEEQDLEMFCRAAPKVELHIHLDGCFDPEELWVYLEQNPHLLRCFPIEKTLPWEKNTNPDAPTPPSRRLRDNVAKCRTSLDYRRLCTCRRRYRKLRHEEERRRSIRPIRGSLEDMLLCFEFFLPLVYDNFDLLEYLACDFVRRQCEQNVVYTEVRYSPQLLASDPRLAHQAVTKGLRRGCQEFSDLVVVNQILCGINFCPEWASDVVDMAMELRNDFPCAVVGIDVAAGEDHFSSHSPFHSAHWTMCQKAIQHDIPITLHAGEVPGSKHNVARAILDYGAKRIGHGYAIAGDEETMDLIKAKDVHIEACPTSSVETGGWTNHTTTTTTTKTTTTDWKDHPACILRSNGVKVSLSTDDPAVFNTSLTWQWRIALKSMGWSKEDFIQMSSEAMDASFAPDQQKYLLRQRFQRETNYLLSSSQCCNDSIKLAPNPDFRDRVHYD
jgi:adenosine deaminase